jgi:hypothetical protein
MFRRSAVTPANYSGGHEHDDREQTELHWGLSQRVVPWPTWA